MLLKCWTQDVSKFGKLNGGHRTGKDQFSFHRQRMFKLPYNCAQYSRLENPMDGGAWWATVYGVAQSLTRLKQLSSSSSNMIARLCSKFFKLGFSSM